MLSIFETEPVYCKLDRIASQNITHLLTVNLSPGHTDPTIILKESRTLEYSFKMWLSTGQSFKLLSSVRKSFESKRKPEVKRKCGRRQRTKKHLPESYQISSYSIITQKNQRHLFSAKFSSQ